MTLFALTNKGVAVMLNRVYIALNKFLIMLQSYVIKIMKKL